MFYHNTIRRYTLALLNFFNNMELQYESDNGQIITKSIPIRYKTREKLLSIDKSTEQELSGNTNVLPRAYLELTSLSPDTERQVSKYLKINRNRQGTHAQYQWNCLSYSFSYKVSVLCRGFNEISQIIEQVAPKFNPNIAIDIRDAENEQEPTRIPVQLGGVDFEVSDYNEQSNNVCTVNFDLTLSGYLFEPIKTYALVKQFNVNLNTPGVISQRMSYNVVDSIPGFDYTISTFEREDVLTIDNLKLEYNGTDTVTVSYRCNSEKTPTVTFTSESGVITRVDGNTCIVEHSGAFGICAKVELNGQYYTVFSEF